MSEGLLIAQAFIDALPDEQADEILVRASGEAMRSKLARKRKEGYGGWHRNDCNTDLLRERLREHVEKGDPIDIMNFAAMIYVRSILYGKAG